MKTTTLPPKTLEWLLDDNNPPVRNLTKQYILDKSPTESELSQVNEYSPIKSILSLMRPDGSCGDRKDPYKKYTGNYWQIIFLCDMNADMRDESFSKVSEHIFSYQLSNGMFPYKTGVKLGLICLTANIIRSLCHFGLEDDLRVQDGIQFLSDQIIERGGAVCYDPLFLLPDCQMALSKILAMYATLDKSKNTSKVKKSVQIVLDKISENRILYYVPYGAKQYYKAIKGKKTSEIRKIKAKFANQPEMMKKTEPKTSWKRFGFPHSYTSDALETLYWLAMIDAPLQSEYNEAIDLVIQRMDPSGYWINENNFRNPMLVDIEPKKAPSKWLTFRAAFVLKTYRNLTFSK